MIISYFCDKINPFAMNCIIPSNRYTTGPPMLDGFWVGRTNAWTIPGTEDLKPYITAKDKCRKWLFGTVGMVVISAILAGIMLLFPEKKQAGASDKALAPTWQRTVILKEPVQGVQFRFRGCIISTPGPQRKVHILNILALLMKTAALG